MISFNDGLEEWPPVSPIQPPGGRGGMAAVFWFAMFYTYILKSRVKNKTYTGSTNNIIRRLAEHNSGKVKSSRPFRPYDIIHVEEFETETQAKKREAFFKTSYGRRQMKKILNMEEWPSGRWRRS